MYKNLRLSTYRKPASKNYTMKIVPSFGIVHNDNLLGQNKQMPIEYTWEPCMYDKSHIILIKRSRVMSILLSLALIYYIGPSDNEYSLPSNKLFFYDWRKIISTLGSYLQV